LAIEAGRVRVNGFPVRNPRTMVADDARITVDDAVAPLRGTVKLRAALAGFGLPVAGRVAVDLGASTGGFTVALLEAGAARVYAVDAGHGQLLGSLRNDPRVVNLERTNLGDLSPAKLPEPAAVVTIDLAYLALARAAPQIAALVPMLPGADVVALVKPMFELGLARAPVDDASIADAIARAAAGFEAAGFTVVGHMPSPVPGGRGAREAVLHVQWMARSADPARNQESCDAE
jgi:23S rRNA (cytidine1920-2'-O)/16S rRNA (cytidine1409-2'-O)-methyltransferase